MGCRELERTINSSWCDATKNLWKLVNSSRISFSRHFVSARRDFPPRNLRSLLLFSPTISVRKWAMSIRELHGQKRPVFLWPANRTAIIARQSSQTQDIKGRLRSLTSGSAIHRIIVAVVQPDLLMHRNICFERKLSCCKMDVTRWSGYVQFRAAY